MPKQRPEGLFYLEPSMNGFISYLKNVRAELKHVVWPTQRQAVTHVVLILLISAFATLFIAGLDYVFTRGVEYLIINY